MARRGMHVVTGAKVGVDGTAARELPVRGLAGWLMAAVAQVWGGEYKRGARRREMRVVETLTIGAKKQLVLVSCGGERFLVGTGAEGVGTIVRVGAEADAAGASLTARELL